MRKGEAVHKLHIVDEEVPDNTTDLVPVRNKIQTWASQNAYTLIFLSVMFFVTWGLLILSITEKFTANA